MKQKKKELDLKMLRVSVLMVCGGNHTELEKTVSKWTGQPIEQIPVSEHDNSDGRTIYGGGFFSVWCRTPKPSLIAHEAVHVSMEILRNKGIALDEELIAYMVQHLVGQYLDAFS